MIKVKVSRNVGLKVGERKHGGAGIFENVFLNLNDKEGTEIELTEKQLKEVIATVKKVIKVQKILADAANIPEEMRFDYELKTLGK